MSNEDMAEMAELLKRGAIMLGDSCPRCSTPLFKLKTGEIVCPSCQREVKIVSRDEDVELVEAETSLTRTVSSKLSQLQKLLEMEEEPEKIREIAETISKLLKVKEQIRK